MTLTFGHAPNPRRPQFCICGKVAGHEGWRSQATEPPTGAELRDAGMDATLRAERPEWIIAANRWRDALPRGQEFDAEDMTAAVGRPERPNSVGARLSAWARGGLIERIGSTQAQRRERHASWMSKWRKL